GWRRVYDLPERVIPPDLLAQEPDRDACARELVRRAARAMGVATVADLADYHRQPLKRVSETVADAGLVPVRVAGWHGPAWADPAALEALGRGLRGRHRTTLLSPFDSLVWFGARTKRIFGFARRLEAYVPRAQRVHGYFAMPLLAGGRIVGRVDPAREGRTLVARQVSLARPAVPAMAAALTEAAAWVGCDAVALERVDPAELAAPLAAALRGAGEPPAVRPPASARDGAPGSSRPARARPAPPPPRASRPGS
ncbi:MAG TPA: crosslink repair DNA glycosylase YcaQ family protein, partial [Miltoncostaeaceae bacterium]|nr:crosslink repair DNA glycosylase YcaQ family protein [Miltoncostaeaceae bacterium]